MLFIIETPVPEANHHSQSEHLQVSRGAGFCEVMMFLLL